MKPRGFARRWASVTNPLVLVATGLKSVQIVGLAGMSFPTEKRKDRRANNSFKPTPFRCVACVRSLRSHASPHRSRRGLTQALGASRLQVRVSSNLSRQPVQSLRKLHRAVWRINKHGVVAVVGKIGAQLYPVITAQRHFVVP